MHDAEYWDLVTSVANSRRDEIARDLLAARQAREAASEELVAADRRVALFELLLSLTEGQDADAAPKRTTLHDAMRQVLSETPGRRMPATDLAREINRRGLYKMRDGRPVEAQQIHARAGNYGGFDRSERGIGLT